MFNRKKYQEQMINVSKEYLTGVIDFETLINKLINNDKLLRYFSNFLKQNSGRNFPSKETLITIKNTYWQRHDFYNIMYSYLFILGIEVEDYAPEYFCFKELKKACPKWFQPDIVFFQKKFENLYEIMKNNQLEIKMNEICKCENNVFPIWLQGPTWPIIDDEPAVFVNQTKLPSEIKWDDIEICYYFKDLNGNEIVVKQFT